MRLFIDETSLFLSCASVSMRALLNLLRLPTNELVDQIFIITHEEELKQIPGTVYVLGRNKAANAPTEVSGA